MSVHDPTTDALQSRSLRVRPYALTGGRTRSSTDLPLETIVRTTAHGANQLHHLHHERRKIADMGREPLAIAEISAHLHVPLGVARVLVGDMVTEGLLMTAQAPQTSPDARPDTSLLERVLHGLQSL
ncbi:MAG: DUF742 domain-containing protein [Acidimicrobiia bacterium]|nr:DUF742 domain-containing protein [Acidimicrobiia bacterium]